jgi:SAM-dependent methyltransferase
MSKAGTRKWRFVGAKLDLGCGTRKRGRDYIGVDLLPGPGVDIVGDAGDVLGEIPSGVVQEVYCSHFLEHVPDPIALLSEISRVLREGGDVRVIVPHFSNPYFYSDPTHVRAFGLYSLCYIVRETPFKRMVPVYGEPLPLRLTRVSLHFKAAPPFYFRYALRRAFGVLVNKSRATQEFYEDNLSGLVPCYEVEFCLVRT